MATSEQRPKLLVIVGPTASGKSELAMRIAQEFDGEIIAADSRTIYKGMNIGTAKPSAEDQKLVPHWGLDLIEPGQTYSASQFKDYAEGKIAEIQARDRLPVLVGGTGLYIDGVLFDFKFRGTKSARLRTKLEKLSIEELQSIIRDKHYIMPENNRNRRYLIRTIETAGQVMSRNDHPRADAQIIGLLPPDEVLRDRIDRRAEKIFEGGIIKEARETVKKYGPESLKNAGIIYKICAELFERDSTQKEALEKFKTADWQYARRQKTWFKRNPYILWHGDIVSAEHTIKQALNT